jgi:TetR/AcrR family transcriptional regulator, cholesterol catabolism regulator
MTEVQDTADRIKAKAHALFMQYGLRSVSMDDIAKELGISKKTIYQFYADKDALVDEVILEVFAHDRACCERDKANAENAVHEIFLAIDFIIEIFKTMNPSVLHDLQKFHPVSFNRFVTHKDTYLYNMVLDNLKRGIAEEVYRPDFKIETLARFRVEAMMLPFNPSFQGKLKTSLVQIEEELTIHFLFGLVSPKGYKLATKYQQDRIKKAK